VEFFEVLKKRYSVRAYKPDPISDETLKQILEAINSAPSAGNLQAYEVVVVRVPER
jgi:nitroreductase